MILSARRFWLLFAILTGSAALSLAHLFVKENGPERVDLSVLIPRRIGGWEGRDLEITEGTRRFLGTENVLLRRYDEGSRSVVFCLTFAGSSHRTVHPPRVCYEGQGWSILADEQVELAFPCDPPASKQVNRLRIAREGKTQDVVFWFRTPERETASYLGQKFELILGRLFGGRKWTAGIRLSSPVELHREEAALEAITQFGADLIPCLDFMAQTLEGGR